MERPTITIAGVGESGCLKEDSRSIPEMVLCAVEQTLNEAGVGYDAIDAVVTASVDLFDGLTASNIAVTEVVGAVMRPESRIAADGLAALLHASCQIWAGAYDTVLVVAHGKASMSPHDPLTSWAMDPVYLQPLDVNFLICSALQAETLKAADPDAELRWAGIASERRTLGATFGIAPACSPAAVLASPMISSPLREAMRAPLGDGAYAVLLQKETNDSPSGRRIHITGLGNDLSPQGVWTDSPDSWAGLHRACARAYACANLNAAASSFDIVEPSCFYAHEEELFLAASGLAEDTPISTGGGLFAGVAPATAGLSRLIAAVRQIRERDDVSRALAHGSWGPAGQGQVVAILEASAA